MSYSINKEAIDIISEWDLQVILNNPSVSRVVQNFWNGPYETGSMMSKSTIIRDIQTKFTKDRKLLNMSNIDNYKYSITKLK